MLPLDYRCWRRVRLAHCLAAAIAAGICLWVVPGAGGHAALMEYIRHDAVISVGPTNIDVTLELTFHEMPSLVERRRMDHDHDGAITNAEVKAYLADRTEMFESEVKLRVGGRALELIPLYDPGIDLLGVDGIGLSHHVLKLFYFVRTPTWLRPGDEIVLEDRLWTRAPSVCTGRARGEGGIQVLSQTGNETPAAGPGKVGPLLTRLRLQNVPANVGYHATEVGSARDTLSVASSAGREVNTSGSVTGLETLRGRARMLSCITMLILCGLLRTRRSAPRHVG